MSLSGHLVELSEKHRQIERMIQEELARPRADEVKIQRLKHEKLRLKDELAKFKSGTRH